MIRTIVSVSQFNGEKAKANKNGHWPLYLSSLTGAQLPPRGKILDGTIAMRNGMVAGKNYLVSVAVSGTSDAGPNYSVTNLGEITAVELAKMGAISFDQPSFMPQQPVVVAEQQVINAELL